MDEAGLLNSMTKEQLKVTCMRLQRSYQDMEMLFHEFQAEQVLLRREQDRLHQRVEKVTAQAETRDKVEDHGIIWSMMTEVDNFLEVSQLFKAKEARKAAKRRRWIRGSGPLGEPGGPGAGGDGGAPGGRGGASGLRRPSSGGVGAGPGAGQALRGVSGGSVGSPGLSIPLARRGEDSGPFSEASVKMSWGSEATTGKLRVGRSKAKETDLERWVRDTVCGDPVAEAEPLSESAQVWGAQFGIATPEQRGRRGFDLPRSGEQRSGETRASPRQHTPESGAPGSSPPGTARRTSSRPEAGSSPGAWGGYAPDGESFADFGEGLISMARDSTPQVLGRRLSAPLSQLASLADSAADWLKPAESVNSRNPEQPLYGAVTVTVVLRRADDDRRWGLAWETQGFKMNRERVVAHLQAGSVAESWNKIQEQSGCSDHMIHAGDRLISANGRTGPDEIKVELGGREVVLEFRRMVQRGTPPPARSSTPSPSPSPSGCRAPGSPLKPQPPKRAFQAAFTDYLKAVAPDAVAPPQQQQEKVQQPCAEDRAAREAAAAAEAAAEAAAVPAAASAAEVVAAAIAMETEGGDLEDEVLAAPPSEAPFSVVVQVLSRGSGSVRLSWLFDWAAAPAELREQAWASRSFFVIQKSEENGAEVRHGPFSQPVADLELATGQRHAFEVQAALLDGRGAEGEDRLAAWTSPSSPSVSADLRAPSAAAAATAAPGAAAGAAAPAAAASATAPAVGGAQAVAPARRRGVASSLGSFLAQRPTSLASVPATIEEAPAGDPTPPVSPAGDVVGVAAAPSAPGSLPASPSMGGGGSASGAAVVMGPFFDPSSSSSASRSRHSAVSMLDPIKDKRDIMEILKSRRSQGGRDATVDPSLRQRSSSFDSDDEGSLVRLAGALGALERTTAAIAAAKQAAESVAEEGHHSLQDRLDGGGPGGASGAGGGQQPPEPLRATGSGPKAMSAQQSAAAAAAALARGYRPHDKVPVEKPAQDSADDAGWTNLGEADPPAAAADPPAASAEASGNGTSAAAGGGAGGGAEFRLAVQVADGQVAVLSFDAEDDLPTRVRGFMTDSGMKSVFEEPLLTRAEAMKCERRFEDAVDIIDLLD